MSTTIFIKADPMKDEVNPYFDPLLPEDYFNSKTFQDFAYPNLNINTTQAFSYFSYLLGTTKDFEYGLEIEFEDFAPIIKKLILANNSKKLREKFVEEYFQEGNYIYSGITMERIERHFSILLKIFTKALELKSQVIVS